MPEKAGFYGRPSDQLRSEPSVSTIDNNNDDDVDDNEHKKRPRFAHQRRVYAVVSRAVYGSPWPRRIALVIISILLMRWALHVVIHTRDIYNRRERRYKSNVAYIKTHCSGMKEIEHGSVAMENCEAAQLATANYLLPSVAWEAINTELDELFAACALIALPSWLAWTIKYTSFVCIVYFWATHGVVGGIRAIREQWALWQLEALRVTTADAVRLV